MARSNLAYQLPERRQNYKPEPIAMPRPQLRTIEGQGRRTAAKPQQATWVRTLVIMCATIVIVLATTSVARVSISNATVQMMQASEQTQEAIDQARAVGLELEVRHSVANNPNRIQDTAAAMGVLPSGQPETTQARRGFTNETKNQMAAAAEEARAAELALLTAGIPLPLSDFKASARAVKAPMAGNGVAPEASVETPEALAGETPEALGTETQEYLPEYTEEYEPDYSAGYEADYDYGYEAEYDSYYDETQYDPSQEGV